MESPPRLQRWLTEVGGLKPGDRVIASVSGGVDSVALLHLLADVAGGTALPLRLEVAHVHHGLRAAADEDAAFVATLADGLRLPFHLLRADVAAARARRRSGLQDAARAARLERLTELAQAREARAVCTGHHRDDQAETVLLRLLRGAGVDGLAGIPPVRPLAGPGSPLLLRPLLDWPKADLVAYCRARGLRWREDETNADRRFLRNRVRHEVLPILIEAFGAAVPAHLARLAEQARRDAAYLAEQAEAALDEATLPAGEQLRALDVQRLARLPGALRERVLRLAFARASGMPPGILGMRALASLQRLLAGGAPVRAAVLPGRVSARLEPGRLLFEPAAAPLPRRRRRPRAVPVAVPGLTAAPWLGGALAAEVGDTVPEAEPSSTSVAFDRELVDRIGPLLLRSWRPGDRIWLPLTPAPRRLARVFMQRGVPRERRGRVPVVAAGDEVVWAVGVASSGRCAVSDATTEVLHLRWLPNSR